MLFKNVSEIKKEYGAAIANTVFILDASLDLVIKGKNLLEDERDADEITVYQLWTTKSLAEVKDAVFSNFTKTDCGHTGDCGCYYRAHTMTYSVYDKEGIAYFIVDVWSRNT